MGHFGKLSMLLMRCSKMDRTERIRKAYKMLTRTRKDLEDLKRSMSEGMQVDRMNRAIDQMWDIQGMLQAIEHHRD